MLKYYMEVDKLAAGQKYNKSLNYDEHNVKTPAFHDPNLDEWLMASANVVKTEGGVFVFQKGTDDGKAKVLAELSGSKMELYGASIDDRPAATAVSIGTTFTIVDETQNFKTWMSNGVNWGEEI